MLYLQKMTTREPARKQGEMLLFEETDLNYVVQASYYQIRNCKYRTNTDATLKTGSIPALKQIG